MVDEQVALLVQRVQSHAKYQSITPEIVQRLAADALRRGLQGKTAVKEVRSKLHQIGGAYFKQRPDVRLWHSKLVSLPPHPEDPALKNFCRAAMQTHASTAERVPILGSFFQTCLASIAPVSSVIDLACGLNPLAIPWMPLSSGCSYHACDIYLDMLGFISRFLRHMEIDGSAEPCDLVSYVPPYTAQLAFLLKTIPCLEQLDKTIALPLLRSIPAEHILVSFPVRSLGGTKKGMPNFYRDHFYNITAGQDWKITEFSFSSELAFLVEK